MNLHPHRWGPWVKGIRGRKLRLCLEGGCGKAQNPRGIVWEFAGGRTRRTGKKEGKR